LIAESYQVWAQIDRAFFNAGYTGNTGNIREYPPMCRKGVYNIWRIFLISNKIQQFGFAPLASLSPPAGEESKANSCNQLNFVSLQENN
jgi:hypothetical protein